MRLQNTLAIAGMPFPAGIWVKRIRHKSSGELINIIGTSVPVAESITINPVFIAIEMASV